MVIRPLTSNVCLQTNLLNVCPGLRPFPSKGRLNGCWTFVRIILKPKKSLTSKMTFKWFVVCRSDKRMVTFCRLRVGSAFHLLMELTLGTVSPSHTPSVSSRSLISHANMVGFCLLYSAIFSTTFGVATLGLEPPITPGLMLPVS